jgi:hypothetical protein
LHRIGNFSQAGCFLRACLETILTEPVYWVCNSLNGYRKFFYNPTIMLVDDVYTSPKSESRQSVFPPLLIDKYEKYAPASSTHALVLAKKRFEILPGVLRVLSNCKNVQFTLN